MADLDHIGVSSAFDPSGFVAGLAQATAEFQTFLQRTGTLSAPMVVNLKLSGITEAVQAMESQVRALPPVNVPVTVDAARALAVLEQVQAATDLLKASGPIALQVGTTGAGLSPAVFTEFGDAALASLGKIEVAMTQLGASLQPLTTAFNNFFTGVIQGASQEAAAIERSISRQRAARQTAQPFVIPIGTPGLGPIQADLNAVNRAFDKGRVSAEDYATAIADIRARYAELRASLQPTVGNVENLNGKVGRSEIFAGGAARANLTLRSSLVVLAAQATGTSSTFARLAESFLLFGGGTRAVVASFGAILVAATVFEVVTKNIQAARKATDEFIKSANESARTADAVGKIREAFSGVDEPGGRKIEGLTERARRLNEEIRKMSVAPPPGRFAAAGIVDTGGIEKDIQKLKDVAAAARQVGLAFLDPILSAQRSAADQATKDALAITQQGIARRQDALKSGFANELVSQDQFFERSRQNNQRSADADLAALQAQLGRAKTALAHASAVNPSGDVIDPKAAIEAGAAVDNLKSQIVLREKILGLTQQQSKEEQAAARFTLLQTNATAAIQAVRLSLAAQPALLIPVQVDIGSALVAARAAQAAILERIQTSQAAKQPISAQDTAKLAEAGEQIRTLLELPIRGLLDSVGALENRLSALQGIAAATQQIANQGVTRPETIGEVAAREAALAPILDLVRSRYALITQEIRNEAIPQGAINDALKEQATLLQTLAEHRAPTAIEVSLLGPVTQAAREFTEAKDRLTLATATGVQSAVTQASGDVRRAGQNLDSLASIATQLAAALHLDATESAIFAKIIADTYGQANASAHTLAQTQNELHQRTQGIVGALDAVGRAASNIGLIGSNASNAITGVFGLIGALDKLAASNDAVKNASGDAQTAAASLGKALSVIGLVSAGLGVLGSIGSALGIGKSQTEKDLELAQRENTAELRRATLAYQQTHGQGQSLFQQQALVGRVFADPGIQQGLRDKDINELVARAAQLGTSWDEIRLIALSFGVQLEKDHHLVAGASSTLAKQLELAAKAATTFADDLQTQRTLAETRDALHLPNPNTGQPDSTDPTVAGLQRTRDLELLKLHLSEEEERRIRSIDLSTKAGQAAFLKVQQDLFKRAAAGQITTDQLEAGFTVTDLLGLLGDAAGGLNTLADAAAAAAKQFQDFNIPTGFKTAALAFAAADPGGPTLPSGPPLRNDPTFAPPIPGDRHGAAAAPSTAVTVQPGAIVIQQTPGESMTELADRVVNALRAKAMTQSGDTLHYWGLN